MTMDMLSCCNNKSCNNDNHHDENCCITTPDTLMGKDIPSNTINRFALKGNRMESLKFLNFFAGGNTSVDNALIIGATTTVILILVVVKMIMTYNISKKGKNQRHEKKEPSHIITTKRVAKCKEGNSSDVHRKHNENNKSKSITRSSANVHKMKRKIDFLSQYTDNSKNDSNDDIYGYSKSKKGFIDTWRQREFPNLIPPIHINIDRKDDDDEEMDCDDESCRTTSTTETNDVIHAKVKDDTVDNSNTTLNLDPYNDEDQENSEPEVYLDYAGSSLPSKTQLESIYSTKNMTTIFANPHSSGPAASRTKVQIERMKKLVLDYFHGHPKYGDTSETSSSSLSSSSWNDYKHPGYDVIFTSGATESLRIVSERFPWTASSKLLYTHNSHTSVVGMRNEVLKQGGMFHCVDLKQLNHVTKEDFVGWASLSKSRTTTDDCHNHLLVLPAECNFGGDCSNVRHIIDVAKRASSDTEDEGKNANKWYIMLDLAKAAATGPINLQQLDPVLACVSFYKIFGEPTGLGALFVKKTAVSMLTATTTTLTTATASNRHNRRYYFGGGSVDAVIPRIDFTYPRDWMNSNGNSIKNNVKNANASSGDGHGSVITGSLDSLVHGTIHFRGIVALLYGFREIDNLGGIERISLHSRCLAAELVTRFRQLRHDNGNCAVVIYGAWADYDTSGNHSIEATSTNENTDNYQERGGQLSLIRNKLRNAPGPTIAFNIYRHDGSPVGYNEVSKLAALNHPPLQLRTGCFCNPGACQEALRLRDEDVIRNFVTSGHVCGDHKDVIDGKPTGSIRVSFGKDSLWEDMDSLVVFVEKMFIQSCRQLEQHSGLLYEEKSFGKSKLNQGVKIKREYCKGVYSSSRESERILSEMYIFPIKSCAAMRVNKWQINRHTGKLAFDREFALVDSTGTAMRLNVYPQMGQILPSIDLDQRTLNVVAPNMPKLVLNLDYDKFTGNTKNKSDNELIRVCGNSCGGQVWGNHDASKWFSSFLGVQCWLARHYRKRNDDVSSSTMTPKNENRAFANEAPLLLISQDSINVLNSVLISQEQRHVKSCHFRPNLVVDNIDNSPTTFRNKEYDAAQAGTNPEDYWSEIIFKKSSLALTPVGQCARCSMVDIDPSSGTKGKTLRALAGYRRKRGEIMFGTFYSGHGLNKLDTICTDEFAWIEEGDILTCKLKAVS